MQERKERGRVAFWWVYEMREKSLFLHHPLMDFLSFFLTSPLWISSLRRSLHSFNRMQSSSFSSSSLRCWCWLAAIVAFLSSCKLHVVEDNLLSSSFIYTRRQREREREESEWIQLKIEPWRPISCQWGKKREALFVCTIFGESRPPRLSFSCAWALISLTSFFIQTSKSLHNRSSFTPSYSYCSHAEGKAFFISLLLSCLSSPFPLLAFFLIPSS